MKKYFLIILSIISFQALTALDVLKLEDAIKMALKNNYGILVANNDLQASENNVNKGEVGYLPRVDFTSGANISNSNSKAGFAIRDEEGNNVVDPVTGKFQTREVSVPGVTTWNANAGLNVSYTVFDGFGRRTNYQILETRALQSREQLQNTIETTVSQVINAYYQVARLSNTYKIQQQATEVSTSRLQRAQTQRDFGVGTRLQLLNAEVDLNADSVALANAFLNLDNAKRNMLAILASDLEADFNVDPAVQFSEGRSLEALWTEALATNPSLQLLEVSRKLSELNLNLAQAARYPRLDLTGSYGYRYSDNGPVSFVLTSENLSLNGGASLNVPIFNGGQLNRQIENATIATRSSQLRYEEAKKNLERDLRNALANYSNSLQVLQLQQKSLEAAELNFEQTREQYDLGQATSTQFREAQLNLIRVQNQLNDLRYDTKLFESELQRLTGGLGE
jgi:outer membrane protein TolC